MERLSLGRAVDEVDDPPLIQRVHSRETEVFLKSSCAMYNQIPRFLLRGLGGKHSVVSVN